MNEKKIDDLIRNELNLSFIKNKTFYEIYRDFNWEIYKELNPYLYFLGLKTEKEYLLN